jgi:signal transduction histidine kinase/tetratricopeptide (TPR) repeat protein
MRDINPGYGQFRWIVLLLAVAVILPTLCLLWFMNAVVDSERLVARQRLTTVYKGKLAEVTGNLDDRWAEYCRGLMQEPPVHPYAQFVSAVGSGCAGLLTFDEFGRCLYPVLSTAPEDLTRPSETFGDAWEMEFVKRDYEAAAERYEQYAQISDDHGQLAACIGKARVLAKLGRIDQAITECGRAASSPLAKTGDSRSLALIANARLLMLGWTRDKPAYAQLHKDAFQSLLAMLYAANGRGFSLPADENLFIARKVLETGGDDLLAGTTLRSLVDAEEQSISLAGQFPEVEAFDRWTVDKLRPIKVGDRDFFAAVHRTARGTCAALFAPAKITRALADYSTNFEDLNVDYCIVDEAGRQIAGIDPTGRESFADGSASQYLPGWSVRLFFKDGDVFKRAADKRIAMYTWTGVLVIVLILASGAIAAQSIGKQVKLNRLKNDFIATVTHELKTPLASMRVLVDTLLDGHYRNPQQATEYLQLVSRENERLTRLIDNFLTFSRMERNKQAFQIRPVSPASIARTAAEAVKTKFSRGSCRFETDIPDDLPDIKADHDALVTVLVNLLDNAYKYSHEDKWIKLSVTCEDGAVCFRVADNGLGIPRRAFKKIFRRFYQVDRSLSRRAEGCGLGLSIARFIIEAHHGKITIDSKLNQGSTFTVAIPAAPSP